MNWRRIDNLLISKCIQQVQKDINEGRLKATEMIPIQGIEGAPSTCTMLFNAWRAHLIDRMMKEYGRNYWDNTYNLIVLTDELDEDVQYYKNMNKLEESKK